MIKERFAIRYLILEVTATLTCILETRLDEAYCSVLT